MSGIKSAVLAGLVVALGMPSITLAQSGERAEALARGLGADASAELLEGLIPSPLSKQEATDRDAALLEQLDAIEAEEEEEENPRIEGGETLLITANIDVEKFSWQEALDAATLEFTSDPYKARLLGRNTFVVEQNGVL